MMNETVPNPPLGPGQAADESKAVHAPGPPRLTAESSSPEFEKVVCCLCGRPPTEHLVRTRDVAFREVGEFNLVRCGACDLIMTDPRPVPRDMHRYYDRWYAYTSLAKARDEQVGFVGNRFVAASRLRFLERTGSLERGARMLDVGAGFGWQLDHYIRRRGVVATSLDFDAKTCEHSIVKDRAEIRTGDLLDVGFEPESFDVVTLYQALEHVYHPKAVLEEVHRILKPGGRLVIDVPDWGAWWRRVWGRRWFGMMVPTHLFHFTKGSLRTVVTAAGFETILQRSMYWPFEATASLIIAYADLFGIAACDVAIFDRVVRHRPYHLPFFVLMILWAVLVDIPVQGLLWLIQRTGVQGLVAVKRGGTTPAADRRRAARIEPS